MTPASATRSALLDAAAALMREGGVAQATTARVARAAGVAEGTIYRHFPSKEELVEAVFSRIWERMGAALEARLPARREPRARVQAYLGAALGVFADHPEEAALLDLEYLHRLARGERVGCTRLQGGLEEAIRLAQEAGAVRADLDAWTCASVLFQGVAKTWCNRPPDLPPEQLVARLQAVVDAVLTP